jgi:hypothetical protein
VGIDRNYSRRLLPVILGVMTLADVVLLFAWDAAPRWFPPRSHEFLASFSLALIAVAYLIFQGLQRNGFMEMVKAILLAAAFLFWAANQFWPSLPQAGLFNDIAIGLFVLDVFLVMVGWPPAAGKVSSFGESSGNVKCRCDCGCTNCG